MKEESENTGLKLNSRKIKIMAPNPITPRQTEGGKVEMVTDFIFLGSKITVDGDCMKLKDACSLEEKLCQTLMAYWTAETSLCPYSQSYGFSCSLIWLLELDHKEDWVPKNWYFQNVVLEKTLESPLDSKEIKPVYLKGN